jgi:hypothetical protein
MLGVSHAIARARDHGGMTGKITGDAVTALDVRHRPILRTGDNGGLLAFATLSAFICVSRWTPAVAARFSTVEIVVSATFSGLPTVCAIAQSCATGFNCQNLAVHRMMRQSAPDCAVRSVTVSNPVILPD